MENKYVRCGIHATISMYNDRTLLPLALDSVKHFTSIIVADGAYQLYFDNFRKQFPDAKPWSTDGSLQMLKYMPGLPPIRLIETPNGEPWVNQCVKRTALLNQVPDGDWFVILDSDEMLYGDLEQGFTDIMESGCIAGSVPLYNPGLDTARIKPFWHPRVFLKTNGMHYWRKHWLLRDWAGRIIEFDYPMKWTDAFVVAHLKVFKERERLDTHQEYMRVMSEDGWIEPHSAPFNLNPVRREIMSPVPRENVLGE